MTDEDAPMEAETHSSSFTLEVEFDSANLTYEDIGLIQSQVMARMIGEAAAYRRAKAEAQGVDATRWIPMPLPHGKYSKHSKTHTKFGSQPQPDTEIESVDEAGPAEVRNLGGDMLPENNETAVFANGHGQTQHPHAKFSKSHSKHTKGGIGL